MDHVAPLDQQLQRADDASTALITLSFSRLWDLLSPQQRQFALHLAEFEHFKPNPSPLDAEVGLCWGQLPESLRLSVLRAFAQLPDVYFLAPN